MRDPLSDVVGTQLAADAVKRAGLSAFPRDRVTYLTLLSGVDLLPLLDLRGILGRRGGGDGQYEHDREQRTHQTSSFRSAEAFVTTDIEDRIQTSSLCTADRRSP